MPPPQPQRPLTDRGDVDTNGNLTDRRSWITGILVQAHYTNYKHDPHPIMCVLYAGRNYTHMINVSYLTGQQRRQFKAQLRFWYWIDPRLKYFYLKRFNKSVLHAYRTPFTMFLHPYQAWEIDELEGTIPEAYDFLNKLNGPAPTDWSKTKARVQAAARERDVAVISRELSQSARPNVQKAFTRPNARPLSIRVTEAVRRIDARIDSGAIRPIQAAVRPRSQRPGQ